MRKTYFRINHNRIRMGKIKYKLIVLLGLCLPAVLLYSFLIYSPESTSWYPKCPFFFVTGYQCPSCGGQRMLYAFCHANFRKAIEYNPFLSCLTLPYLSAIVISKLFLQKKNRLYIILSHHYTILLYFVVFIGWWIIRNIYNI